MSDSTLMKDHCQLRVRIARHVLNRLIQRKSGCIKSCDIKRGCHQPADYQVALAIHLLLFMWL